MREHEITLCIGRRDLAAKRGYTVEDLRAWKEIVMEWLFSLGATGIAYGNDGPEKIAPYHTDGIYIMPRFRPDELPDDLTLGAHCVNATARVDGPLMLEEMDPVVMRPILAAHRRMAERHRDEKTEMAKLASQLMRIAGVPPAHI